MQKTVNVTIHFAKKDHEGLKKRKNIGVVLAKVPPMVKLARLE